MELQYKCLAFILVCTYVKSMRPKREAMSSDDDDGNFAMYYNGHGKQSNFQTGAGTKNILSSKGVGFADGMVSVDCLRCLCLKQSDCKPVGCTMRFSAFHCGYFQITTDIWTDCGKLGSGLKECADDVNCSSQCVQNYMARYARRYNCVLYCEGFTRELFGGPNGCNKPATIPYWKAVQRVPGCKGVE